MRVKRWVAAVTAGAVMTPVALGIGVVLLISTFGDRDGGNIPLPTANALRIGQGGVPAEYAQLIINAAAACTEGLAPSILAAQLEAESNFDPTAISRDANHNPIAYGIAQFIPDTWATRGVDGNGDGVKNVMDPADAIPAQGRMMCELLHTAKQHPDYNGSPIELALAGYNAGWGRVDQFRGVPPSSFAGGETHDYVRKIMASAAKFAAPVSSTDVNLPAGYSLPADTPAAVRTAVSWALKQRGGWYQWGGDCTQPLGSDTARRCDCSSLMQQAYKAAGIDLPRTTFEQVDTGRQVSMDNPKPGDLVFNAGSDGSDARPGHVGMYIGNNMLVEAPRTGVQTRVVSYSSWRNSTSALTRITAVRRVVNW
ncbi:C40 family peptidase [Streptomyces violascens]|uniref:Transglycosylase n=1 Tax=Streptomyces violascens TaxID=67381 RepID=A0ABQ3QL81_9ACTN|nr:bifunctional lytic transglycosylase/C40 family peptidase [Streptomyces violascens]GGU44668.1 transglycosylase [Streptomyces violascens]GHI38028.1 transglycosylase [Streptomyces violascens]